MAENKTLTAPLAEIYFGDAKVGKMKNIRVTENYQRADVRGISALVASEKPIIGITCSFTASAFMIDLTKFGTIENPFAIKRNGMNMKDFLNTILLSDNGVRIVLRKIKAGNTSNGVVTSTELETMGIINNAYIDSQSFDITEGQVSGQDISGSYLEPILM